MMISSKQIPSRQIIWLVMGIATLVLMGKKCQKADKTALNDLNTVAGKQWKHSHEEDAAGSKVYRPTVYAFPPSRGRAAFELMADGQFIDYPIAPTDGNQTAKGQWKAVDNQTISVEIQSPKPRTFKMVFKEVANDRLVIQFQN
jgi:hypothetical protein